MHNFARRLREIRLARRLTQAKLAAQIDVSVNQVQHYEKGRNMLPAERLMLLASVRSIARSPISSPTRPFEPSRAAPARRCVATTRCLCHAALSSDGGRHVMGYAEIYRRATARDYA
jgi:transcriptional regulator with XRE-family HTH domain